MLVDFSQPSLYIAVASILFVSLSLIPQSAHSHSPQNPIFWNIVARLGSYPPLLYAQRAEQVQKFKREILTI